MDVIYHKKLIHFERGGDCSPISLSGYATVTYFVMRNFFFFIISILKALVEQNYSYFVASQRSGRFVWPGIFILQQVLLILPLLTKLFQLLLPTLGKISES